MMTTRRKGTKPNIFEEQDKTDLESFADEIYGASDPTPFETGRVVAKPTDIFDIWADLAQPRRAIPLRIRGDWNGDPTRVPALLEQWRLEAARLLLANLNLDQIIKQIIKGNAAVDLPEGAPALAAGYVALLQLASTIYRDGLINPIGVVKRGIGDNIIETGERRWLAHHLIHTVFPDEGFNRIAAIHGKQHNIWRQATENTARRELNAIGMARQLALLIMDVREEIQRKEGSPYEPFSALVAPGGCDRRFYAQVADGNIHRLPKGEGERIQAAMGLSKKRLADYRSLLRLTEDDAINDALWLRADAEDWADLVMRDIRTLPLGNLSDVIRRDNWTLNDLRFLVDEMREARIEARVEAPVIPRLPVAPTQLTPPPFQAPPRPPAPIAPPAPSVVDDEDDFQRQSRLLQEDIKRMQALLDAPPAPAPAPMPPPAPRAAPPTQSALLCKYPHNVALDRLLEFGMSINCSADAKMVIADLKHWTKEKSDALREAGELEERLELIYSTLAHMLDNWLTSDFAALLNDIENA